MVTNFLRSDYLEDIEANGYYDTYADADDVTISTVSDAGDISFSDAISDATNGVPSDMYETFKTAIQHSYITEDALEDWDSPITKTEAISLFMSMSFNYTTNEGSSLVSDYIDQGTEDLGVKENTEIENSKWADVNGAWDAVHQFTLYARENGADATSGWCWLYYTGEGAGDQPSYAVYMKEDDPLYGTVYHLGDYLPNGELFEGKGLDEFHEAENKDFERYLEEEGAETYIDENGRTVIVAD
jgi:hypothetical protein